MKTGRNDPCPCGKDKKYKHCCWGKTLPTRMPSFFERYNSLDLLQTAAALMVLPENHGKVLRLEVLAAEILRHFDSSRSVAPLTAVQRFLDDEYASYYLEDPTTNLVTDVVPFFGGDYIIFPGITEGGSYVLNNLISAIFQWEPAQLPEAFKQNCHAAIRFMLSLSQLVASELQHPRYQLSTAQHTKIEWPEPEHWHRARAAVVITEDQMQALLIAQRLSERILSEFSASASEFQTAVADGQELLLRKPLLSHVGGYLIASPLSISLALTEFIWEQARLKDCVQQLNEAYQQVVWRTVHRQLRLMGFQGEKVDTLPDLHPSKLCGLYRLDSDKLAIVRLVYNKRLNESTEIAAAMATNLAERQSIVQAVQALPQYAGCQLLELQIPSLDGSDLYLPLQAVDGTSTLVVPAIELGVLNALGEADALDLWKFALAEGYQREQGSQPVPYTSFLDNFKFYREHHDSFYVSDEVRPTGVFIPPSYAADWFVRAKQQVDEHSALVTVNGTYAGATLVVQRNGTFGSTYSSIDDAQRAELRFLVEGFAQPVWVETISLLPETSQKLRMLLYEFTDALAYWIGEVRGGLRPYLNHEQLHTVHVTYECCSPDKFEAEHPCFERVPNLVSYFQTSATTETATIRIPPELLPYLYGADNEGERILVEQMLVAIGKLLEINGLPSIGDADRQAILNTYVPLGQKKKLLILDSADNLLFDPRDLVAKRTVQEYDTSIVLDSLVPGLTERELCPPEGEIVSQADKEKLTRDLVVRVLLPHLKQAIARYDQRDLIGKLLALNERLIRDREMLRVQTPSRIACFVSLDQQVADIKGALKDSARTSVAVRGLIEHISAEQITTGALASNTDIDELIALMDQIIAWGTLGDQLKHRLFETKLSVLPTGRIGIEKSFHNEVLDLYYTAKTHEDVVDAVRYYEQVFPQQHPMTGAAIPAQLDAAFAKDYGISFTQLSKVIEALVRLALDDEHSVMVLPQRELLKAVERVGYSFEESEFTAAIVHLTLIKRENVDSIPDGYEAYDISPWRFNRRLSLLRKPLVAFHNSAEPDNPTIYWGFRQALLSRRNWGSQIQDNRFRVAKGSAVASALATIAGQHGAPLVRKVIDRLQGANYFIRPEVSIKKIARTKPHKDLGDIDVLLIDPDSRIVYSLECKYMAPSRNIQEMAQELDKFFGSERRIGKHVDRHNWLKANLDDLGYYYNLDLTGYTVRSLMVTAEDMLTPYLKAREDLPLPFVSLYTIEREGLLALERAIIAHSGSMPG